MVVGVEIAEEGGAPPPRKTHKRKEPNFGTIKSMDFLQNMSNAELAMIHRLAGNDAEVRKTTIKKLRKWLRTIATKIPDSDGSFFFITITQKTREGEGVIS